MRVCVLSGSPKGAGSITLQTVRFLEKRFPDCTFETVFVGQKIKIYEKDMTEPLAAMARAELLLFCYPVYTFFAPSQLHRFVELVKESGADLRGRFAAQITTSKHFYDVTAHRWVEDNCADLGLRYLGGLSADMDDLLTQKGRREADAFWRLTLWRAKTGAIEPPRRFARESPAPYAASLAQTPRAEGFTVALVHAGTARDAGLRAMMDDFQAALPYPVREVDLDGYPFAGGFLGCFHCASDGECVYRDGFDRFLREQIQTADAIVYAFTIRDHGMGARFKLYDDRQFCNGHRTVTMGAPTGYLVRGDLAAEENLRMALEARAQVGGNFLCGLAQDAAGVERLAETLRYALENGLRQPQNFYGVGGMKIFRDLIYLMRGLMRADHRFFKAHGQYDFPQKHPLTALKMRLVGGMMASPALRKKIGGQMTAGMLAPYEKALRLAEGEKYGD